MSLLLSLLNLLGQLLTFMLKKRDERKREKKKRIGEVNLWAELRLSLHVFLAHRMIVCLFDRDLLRTKGIYQDNASCIIIAILYKRAT